MVTSDSLDPNASPSRWRWMWLVTLSLSLVAGFLLLQYFGLLNQISGRSLEFLLDQLETLRKEQVEHPQIVLISAFALYIGVTGLSLPGAALMSIAFGWMFGFWQGLVLTSFASTTGATIAFLLSRYLLRERVQRLFGDRLSGFNSALNRDGPYYLFSLRLIPAVPFFVVNLVLGLTPIPARTFWWVSQLGMLPGTAVYVYAGTSLPGLEELRNPTVARIISPQLLIALALLGLLPLILKKIANWLQSKTDCTSRGKD